MEKIKLALLIVHMGNGGAQKIIMNYLRDWLEDKDLEVKLFIFSNDLGYWVKNEFENKGYQYCLLGKTINTNSKKVYNNIVKPLKLLKELILFRPNVVHGHITLLLRYIFFPIIISKCKYRFITLHSNPFRVKGLEYWFARIAFNYFNFVPVCLNEEQAQMAQQHYKFKKYELIHNGVDFEKIRNNIVSKEEARKLFNLNNNSFVLCACGRLDKVKNYPLMLDIFKKVLEKRSNSVLLIAGEGPEKDSLINYSEKLRIKDKVRFLGNLDNPIPLYCSANVFLLTSYSESMSLVLMEAQTCGCKCVISAGVPKESIITNKVVSMKENASIEEWTNTILTENVTYEKPRFTEADYEVHAMSQKCKEMYLKYLRRSKHE